MGEAADGVSALELARRFGPDVALVDIRMPRMDGLDLTHLLTTPHPARAFRSARSPGRSRKARRTRT
ncbi:MULTISPECIES: response regulator [unclassified Nonomuraea]|uniref:response regulator n=1 Tax=unclassified Nonomuraea TaxID=2593643 RepID=UPI0013786D1C|nr:response regulator [Nonomuraea sp. KC401]NBE92299.1 response regulator [Nonomuraea sp. K271]